MTYGERIRHPGAALDSPREKKVSGVNWWLIVGLAIVALIVVAILRPQWLSKIGIQVNLSGAAKAVGAVSNPMRWV